MSEASARRRPILGGATARLLVLAMAFGALFLWVGVPAGWLWIGSQVQNSTGVGTAIMVTMVGAIATVIAVVPLLVWANRKHVELQEARGLGTGEHTALEVIMVVSGGIAVLVFFVWFFGFSGASPIPLNLGY